MQCLLDGFPRSGIIALPVGLKCLFDCSLAEVFIPACLQHLQLLWQVMVDIFQEDQGFFIFW